MQSSIRFSYIYYNRLFYQNHFPGYGAGIGFQPVEIYSGRDRVSRIISTIEDNGMFARIDFTVNQSMHLHPKDVVYAQFDDTIMGDGK